MTALRIVIVCILAFFFVTGLRRGLIRQVMEVLGIIAAFLTAFYMAHALASRVEGAFSVDYRLALVLSAALIFIGVIILFSLAGASLQKLFGLTVLGAFDRFLGGLFGALKGVLLISLALATIMVLPFPSEVKEAVVEDPLTSAIYPVLPVMFDLIVPHVPGGARFEQVARIADSEAVRKARDRVGEIGDRLEESSEKLGSEKKKIEKKVE